MPAFMVMGLIGPPSSEGDAPAGGGERCRLRREHIVKFTEDYAQGDKNTL